MNIQKTLIRREFQEHKGGFLFAPAVAAVLFLLISFGGMIAGSVMAQRHGGTVVVDGERVSTMQLGQVLSNVPASEMAEAGKAIDLVLWMAAAWPFVVVAFVAFFYCISALYDERKDRSILFWKSMPVSDNATVVSKAASALLLIPAIAAVISAATMLVFFLGMMLMAGVHGVSPALFLQHASPLSVIVGIVGSIPVYALWALPTAGWLMLCSAFARSKPMLWAILVPLMLGLGVAMLGVGDAGWFFQHVLLRGLIGFVPGTWLSEVSTDGMPFSLANTYAVLASPALWVGAIAGIGMLFAAAYVRRWKDEG